MFMLDMLEVLLIWLLTYELAWAAIADVLRTCRSQSGWSQCATNRNGREVQEVVFLIVSE